MGNRALNIEGEIIQLVEVAKSGDKRLLRFNSDWRISGARLKEVRENFPDYKFEPFETVDYDFLIEEDGKIQLYWPDGEPIEDDEIEEVL